MNKAIEKQCHCCPLCFNDVVLSFFSGPLMLQHLYCICMLFLNISLMVLEMIIKRQICQAWIWRSIHLFLRQKAMKCWTRKLLPTVNNMTFIFDIYFEGSQFYSPIYKTESNSSTCSLFSIANDVAFISWEDNQKWSFLKIVSSFVNCYVPSFLPTTDNHWMMWSFKFGEYWMTLLLDE